MGLVDAALNTLLSPHLPTPHRAGGCCAARLTLALTGMLPLLCWWPARRRDVLAGALGLVRLAGLLQIALA